MIIIMIISIIMIIDLGWVVQRWVRLNSGLSKNNSCNCFSKEKVVALIKYNLDFSRKKLVNSKFTDPIRLCKVGNKAMD